MTNLSELEDSQCQMIAPYKPGEPCDYGCTPDAINQMVTFAESLQTGKRIVAVSAWTWLDLDYPDKDPEVVRQAFEDSGLHPVYVFTDNVLFDTSFSLEFGYWARTSYLSKFHRNCVFETRNSLYILVGSGLRNRVDYRIATLRF